jgi:hypothetical protein
LYFIDGTRIRLIDANGRVKTIIDKYFNYDSRIYKPSNCNQTYTFETLRLYWPTSLSVNPLDNTVYILDDNVIYRITHENRVDVIAGVPNGCNSNLNFIKLNNPTDMDFNTEGDLYILENDRNLVKQIRLLKSTGEIELYFGPGKSNFKIKIL